MADLVPSTDGVAVAVHHLGGPDGAPTLVFCHANGFNGPAWAPLAAHLTDAYRCLAVDLRGHGVATTPDHVDFDWRGFGDDAEAVLASGLLAPDAALHGIGHSLGGAALVHAAARHPAAFRSLWLFEPITPPPFDATAHPPDVADLLKSNPMADAAERRREHFESIGAAIDNFASKPPLNSLHPDALRAYVEGGFEELADGSVRIRCRGVWEGAIYRMGRDNRAWDELEAVAVPVAVAVGEELPWGPAQFAPPVAERLPHGELFRHPELGHFGPLQDPKGMAAEIRDWLEHHP